MRDPIAILTALADQAPRETVAGVVQMPVVAQVLRQAALYLQDPDEHAISRAMLFHGGSSLDWLPDQGGSTMRYSIGTEQGGNFVSDSLGRDPVNAYATLEEAQAEMAEIIAHAPAMFGEPLTNGAIYDNETRVIVWRQHDEAR